MVHPYAVAAFLVAILPMIATPGASLALLIRHVIDSGRRQALPVILGTVTGLYVHAILAIAGLSALVMHSSLAFTTLKLIGAVYLIGLGIWTWRSATPNAAPAPSRPHLPKGPDSVYAQALLANVLNPKAAAIYLTLVPQFIAPHQPFGSQILTLATAHALLIALWLAAWTFLALRASPALHQPRFKQAAAKATSAILVTLGIRSAVA
ncbi:lysine transporter LysE [Streptomyces longisporoflavus]|uniref:LysE family translocator n=1 Tax=Streptomyces longisporoflavus TaxID=28044 RepID=UPI00167D2754|nr:LysE family translocator [Streptomyces longisporoflavus]GGV72775.1 lysine transporter LysE [Streptomyces longisporoflavus]